MSSPPPGPSNATMVIPLPPGFTQKQFESLQGHIVSIAITQAVAFGVLVWDYFSLIRDEINLYQSSGPTLWKTPAAYAFIVLRYAGILATLPSLFFTSIQSTHCQLAVDLSQAGAVLVVASSGIIFGYRVAAIWSGNRIVYSLVIVVYAGMVASWLAVATQYRATVGPPTPFGSNCKIHPIVSWAPICYASSVAFDTLILLLTLLKLRPSTSRSTSGVGSLVYRDSLMYFLTTALTNITVLIIQALPSSFTFTLVKPTAVPFSTLITTTMGVRVFLNLKLFNQRQERAMRGLPLTVKSESSSAGRVVPYTYPLPPPPPTKDVKGGEGGQSWWDGKV